MCKIVVYKIGKSCFFVFRPKIAANFLDKVTI